MDFRKSIHMNMSMRMDSSLNKSPASSSPLRRKSIVAQKQLSSVLSENDDEAERIARRREICTPNTVLPTGSRRHSLGLGFLANVPTPQMAESINQCIKLSAENKINIKNAFSLEMIDFMTYMIKKQDKNMSNLQVASTSLDVSSKIYGFRVDSVHTKILKIIGGFDKQVSEEVEHDQDRQEEAPQENADATLEASKKKKRKRNRQKICSTVEALKGNIEIVKPLSMMIGEGDLHTSDMLYQAMLPNHTSSGFYQHLYNDVLVDVAAEESNVDSTKYVIPIIENFQDLEICTSYSNFEFLGWSVEDEPESKSDTSDEEHNDNEADNRFQFDLDATVEQEDENLPPELVNYFDIETQDYNQVYEQQQRQAATKHPENIVNTSITGSSKLVITPEYSFVLPNASLHWAGPSHWKFHNFAKPLAGAVTGGKIVGACMQAPLKRRKEIELLYEENKDVIETKFTLSQSNKLQAKTAKTEWSAEDILLPEDVHYDITRLFKLYLHQYLSIKPQKNGDKAIDVAGVFDNDRYDYNNPNDTSEYCPDVHNDDYDESKENNNENECNFEFGEENNALVSGFTGDNLITAPKLANKISITYCLKAKRIDMRQLKKSIWKCLIKSSTDADTTNTVETPEKAVKSTMKEPKQFNDIYKKLPGLLTKNNAEALSVPLFFISLLHLANEKTLNMCSSPDMSDITVEKG